MGDMELTYNGVALHELGEITVSQSTANEGGDTPVRSKRTLRVTLDVFEDGFASNYELIRQAKAALKVQHGTLLWQDSETETIWVNQTAVVTAEDLPEDPNGWGTYHQQLHISFEFYEHDLTTNGDVLTLAFTAGNVTLKHMTEWRETIEIDRFDPLRAGMRGARVSVQASGLEMGDTTQALATRRVALQSKRDLWRSRVTGQNETTLTCGTFDKAVRIDRFEAQLNQAEDAIGWSFSGFYNVLPAEGNYAVAEYRVQERNGDNLPATGNGEQFLSITGTVKATNEAAALSKINEIRNTQTTARGYAGGEIVRHEIEDARATGGTVKDGDVFFERTFTIEVRKWRSDNQALTLQKGGGAGLPVNFGQVTDFTDGYNSRRFSDQRSQRALTQGRLEFRGVLHLGTVTSTVTERRALLEQRIKAMREVVDHADQRLIFGSYFDGTVRVEDFQPKLDQNLKGVEWTLTCTYSKFPNEANYATVEMQAEQSDEIDTGDTMLAFSGTIRASSETIARAKLASVRAAVLASYGYAEKHQLSIRSTAASVFANGDKTATLTGAVAEPADGTTFTELSFSESYRKKTASLLSWNLRIADSIDSRSGLRTTTYSGDVLASGATAAAAYDAALTQAQALGAEKHDFLLRSDVTWAQRQLRETADVEFVRLEFTYDYQRKDGVPIFVEISSGISTVAFGNDSETISGYISAPTLAEAEANYESLVKADLASRLILNEDVTTGSQRTGTESLSTAQFTRLEFRIQLFKRRAANTAAYSYTIATERDWLTLTQRSTVSGSCWAATKAEAQTTISGFLGTLGLGKPVRSADTASTSKWTGGSEFGQYDFEEVFETRITGQTAILSCELSEEVEHSGVRWVEQPLPRNDDGSGGVSLFQDAGLRPGKRTVNGTVVAPTKLLCQQWAAAQRVLLTGTYEDPPVLRYGYEFAPRIEGVVSGSAENVRLHRLSFTFSERIAELAYAAPVVPA